MESSQKNVSLEKSTINTDEANEVAYWIDKFDTTKVKLKAAVNAAGPAAKDVETYLKKKWH